MLSHQSMAAGVFRLEYINTGHTFVVGLILETFYKPTQEYKMRGRS